MGMTQKQLAQLADVSIVTVYNALYQPQKVKAETRQKIFDLMRQHDYSPDAVARSMVRGKTNIIGILVPTFEVCYYARLVSAMERRLNALGYRAMISQHLDDPDKEASELAMMREYRVDGIILRSCALACDREQIVKLNRQQIPFVLVDALTEGFEERYVGDDDFTGAMELGESLIRRGRRRIAYIGFHRSGDFRASNRYRGYAAALEHNNIPFEERLTEPCPNEYHSGDQALMRILNRTQDNPIDAVMAVNDNVALMIAKKLNELGYSMQKQIVVTGYGGYLDEVVLPFVLPTIRQDVEKLGDAAVTKLMAEIEGKPDMKMMLVRGELQT